VNFFVTVTVCVCCWCAKEEIRDLLAKDQSKRLELKERPDTGVYVKVRFVIFC